MATRTRDNGDKARKLRMPPLPMPMIRVMTRRVWMQTVGGRVVVRDAVEFFPCGMWSMACGVRAWSLPTFVNGVRVSTYLYLPNYRR